MVEVTALQGDRFRYFNVSWCIRSHGERRVLSIYSNVNGACICDWFDWDDLTVTYQDPDGRWITARPTGAESPHYLGKTPPDGAGQGGDGYEAG